MAMALRLEPEKAVSPRNALEAPCPPPAPGTPEADPDVYKGILITAGADVGVRGYSGCGGRMGILNGALSQ